MAEREQEVFVLFHVEELSILYVEDNEQIREGYYRTLTRLSQKLFLASDGKEGLEIYIKERPDIVITDIRMPVMDGLEMAREIKKYNPQVPIIFTTAHTESDYLLEAIDLQVDGYLVKPVRKSQLVTLVQKIAKALAIEKEHREQQEILQNIVDLSDSLTVITNMTTISFANQALLRTLEIGNIGEFNRKYETFIDIFSDEPSYIRRKDIAEALYKGINFKEYLDRLEESERIVGIRHNDGKCYFYYISVSSVSSNSFLINLTDITGIEEKREETRKKAYLDELTGVYNRYKLLDIFHMESTRIDRERGALALAMFDIDLFKSFNDRYGHLVGDEVLVMIAQYIEEHVRGSDLFVRWGGEEFILLFVDTHYEDALEKCEEMRKAISRLSHPRAGAVTMSFGVSRYRYGETLEMLVSRADDALYRAKQNGRNRVEGEL